MNKKEYKEFADRKTPASKVFRNSVRAYLVGGAICMLGQFFLNTYKNIGLDEEGAAAAVSITLVFLGVLLTGVNIYPKIAKFAGAGTIVPITGFANSVAAPAIEAKTEGMVMGVGAKLFTISGPVIVYGVSVAFLAGIVYWIF